jgi:ABC-type multidrug transport system fused ATPase/permease subunit
LRASFSTQIADLLRQALPALQAMAPLALLGAGAVLCTILSILCDYLWARMGSMVMNDLKRELHDHLLHQPLELITRRPTAGLVNRFSGETTARRCKSTDLFRRTGNGSPGRRPKSLVDDVSIGSKQLRQDCAGGALNG